MGKSKNIASAATSTLMLLVAVFPLPKSLLPRVDLILYEVVLLLTGVVMFVFGKGWKRRYVGACALLTIAICLYVLAVSPVRGGG